MKVSVVIATYGEAHWAELARVRAAPSVEPQLPHECILVHGDEGTLAKARNKGAQHATGDWLVFLDADDELAVGFLFAMERVLRGEDMIAREGPLLLTPAVQYVRGRHRPTPKIWPRQDLRTGNWLVIGTAIPRELFLALGGFREYAMYEDWDLFARSADAGAKVVEVPEAVYVAHAGPRSRNRGARMREKLYWHQRIGRDNWPQLYQEVTPAEDAERQLHTRQLRREAIA